MEPTSALISAPARILVADDDDLMRDLLHELLAHAGYDVTSVASGTAAMRTLHESPYAVALLDSRMPGIDGIDAGRQLRRSLPDASTSLLLVTDRDSRADIEQAFWAGFDDVITRPVDLDDLLARLRRLTHVELRPAAEAITEFLATLRDNAPGELAWDGDDDIAQWEIVDDHGTAA